MPPEALEIAPPLYKNRTLLEQASQPGGVSRLIRQGDIGEWDDLSACQVYPDATAREKSSEAAYAAAKQMCGSCVVRQQCYDARIQEIARSNPSDKVTTIAAGISPRRWNEVAPRIRAAFASKQAEPVQ